MANRPLALKIDGSLLSELPELLNLKEVDELSVQGTIALLTHYNLHKPTHYDRSSITKIFKNHVYTPLDSKMEQKQKTLSSSAPTISRYIQALDQANCLSDEETAGIDGSLFRIRTLNAIKPLGYYLQNKKEIIKRNRDRSSGKSGGRPPAEINRQLIEAVSKRKNVHLILNDAVSVIPISERVTSMLYSISLSEKQAITPDKNGDYPKTVEGYYSSKSVGEVKIEQFRTTSKGMRLSAANDQAVIYALLGLTKRAYTVDQLSKAVLDEHGVVGLNNTGETIYVLDITKLCRELGRRYGNVRERQPTLDAVNRLMFNTWKLSDPESKVTSAFKQTVMSNMDTIYFKYIEPIGSVKELLKDELSGVSIQSDRYIVFKLGTWFQQQIVDRSTIQVHELLKSETDDIAHSIYSICRGFIGHGTQRKKAEFTFYALWQYAAQNQRPDNFETRLLKFAKRQNEKLINPDLLDGYYPKDRCEAFALTDHASPRNVTVDLSKKSGTFWFCGYFIKLEYNEDKSKELHRKNRTKEAIFDTYNKPYPLITIWLDEDDPIVGSKSDRAQRLERLSGEMADASQEEESLYNRLINRGVSGPSAKSLIDKYNPDHIDVVLEYFTLNVKNGTTIANPYGYIKSTLDNSTPLSVMDDLERLKDKGRRADIWKNLHDTSWAEVSPAKQSSESPEDFIEGECEVVEPQITSEIDAELNVETSEAIETEFDQMPAYRESLKDSVVTSVESNPSPSQPKRRAKSTIETRNQERDAKLSLDQRKHLQLVMMEIKVAHPDKSAAEIKSEALDKLDELHRKFSPKKGR